MTQEDKERLLLQIPVITNDKIKLFDIATLKPFDKGLVRDYDTQEWRISFFGRCNGLGFYKYSCINGCGYAQCIPYKNNEHPLGEKDDCKEYYQTWK